MIVPGWATILSACIATKYPPDAATLPMVTMSGLPACFARTVSRQIVSDATYEPPGLSTRKTIARTAASSAAERSAAPTVSAPMLTSPNTGLNPLVPLCTGPTP